MIGGGAQAEEPPSHRDGRASVGFIGLEQDRAGVDELLRARFERKILGSTGAGAGVSLEDFDVVQRARGSQFDALVVHDRVDRRIPFAQAVTLCAALGAQAVDVVDVGYTGILRSDAFLDAAMAFLLVEDTAGLQLVGVDA